MAWALPEGAVLGIFAERPDRDSPGSTLAAELGPELAAELSEATLFDVLETWDSPLVLAPGGRRVVVFAPEDAGPWFDQRVPESFSLQPQVERALGGRLHAFFAGEFEDGADRVVLIGSHTPTLDPSIVISAFLCLEGRDVVLGPATGGGCYLVGSRRGVPPVFEGIISSNPNSLRTLIHRVRGTGASVAVLPPWYEVDSVDGWRMLAGHLPALELAGVESHLPRCEDLLRRLHDRFL